MEYRVFIDQRLCKGCGICVELCPRSALVLSKEVAPTGYRNPVYKGGCIGCLTCMNYCPDFAIAVLKVEGDG